MGHIYLRGSIYWIKDRTKGDASIFGEISSAINTDATVWGFHETRITDTVTSFFRGSRGWGWVSYSPFVRLKYRDGE
jgi:hypothetical protein